MINYQDKLRNIFEYWQSSESTKESLTHLHVNVENTGMFGDFPRSMRGELIEMCKQFGIHDLFHHQSEAIQLIEDGNNLVINTGTASGKTLSYLLPIINDSLTNPNSSALLVYPTKALAYDQYEKLNEYNQLLHKLDKSIYLKHGIYDGDTPKSKRAAIRKNSRILLTNPDMLHYAILPHHTNWENLLENLKYVVFDEVHIYRGVFGSHVANVIRRLKRILALYGAFPQFITTTATIGNPKEFSEKLFEDDFSLIENNTSPNGKKYFALYNPPVINEELNVRRSPLQEAISITSDLLENDIQTLIFQTSRRSVEISLRRLREIYPLNHQSIQAYRSGYLAADRRDLEDDFRRGNIKALFSTNALELGVDIGGLQSVLLVGYPGTIASTMQQMGRSGRNLEPSMAVLVLGSSPIDQYLAQHPEFIFGQSPENVLIDPDNPLLLLQHLRCAAHELMFEKGESYGNLSWDTISTFLEVIQNEGNLYFANGRYMWISDLYPSMELSLRTTGGDIVKLVERIDGKEIMVGEIDYHSALWMTHPGAVYMHQGENFVVKSLDLENSMAHLQRQFTSYYTEPKRDVEIELIKEKQKNVYEGFELCYGEIKVTTQISAYKERIWDTHEMVNEVELSLPPTELITEACWINLKEDMLENLRETKVWNNDPVDYGRHWNKLREAILKRDQYTCQLCQAQFDLGGLHVHHKTPIRMFSSVLEANKPNNLVTLCAACHQRVEANVKIRSGLSGAGYILRSLSPLFLMCDQSDIELHLDPVSNLNNKEPICLIYDLVPYGIGLSQKLFSIMPRIVNASLELAQNCSCEDGCPSCIGPVAENGLGSKKEAIAIISYLDGSFGQES